MRKLFFTLVLALLGAIAYGCDVEFEVGDKFIKEEYAGGEEIVVNLKVVLTHRRCDITIEDTKIGANGGKIIGATKWKQTKPGVYVRKLKIQIVEDGSSELKLVCQRTCHKEGGSGQLVLKKKSV